MSEIFNTGSVGEERLAAHLIAHGRIVRKSSKKSFDLVVDEKYAEVKSSNEPYSKLGFIGLTASQYKALVEGVDFTLFIVCNLKDPANVEVIEIPARNLLSHEPKIEPTYYWYRSQIEKCRG